MKQGPYCGEAGTSLSKTKTYDLFLYDKPIINFICEIEENKEALKMLKRYFTAIRLNLLRRFFNEIKYIIQEIVNIERNK